MQAGAFRKYALMNENAEILEKDKVPTPDYHTRQKEDYYAVLDSVVEKYKSRIGIYPSACLVCWTTGMDIV